MLQLHYFNDCFALRQAMRQQELNIRSAEAQRSNACVAGMSQECSEANQQALREESFYQSLLNRYQRCQTLGTMTSDVSGFAAFPWTLSEPMR